MVDNQIDSEAPFSKKRKVVSKITVLKDILPSLLLKKERGLFKVGDIKMSFVGRQSQIEEAKTFFIDQWKRKIGSRSSKVENPLLAFHGCPGSGKSRLIDELAVELSKSSNTLCIPMTFNSNLSSEIPKTLDFALKGLFIRLLYR
jgi:Cdc6-like AAA superfamily ATPase